LDADGHPRDIPKTSCAPVGVGWRNQNPYAGSVRARAGKVKDLKVASPFRVGWRRSGRGSMLRAMCAVSISPEWLEALSVLAATVLAGVALGTQWADARARRRSTDATI